jgi:hypothetical protein
LGTTPHRTLSLWLELRLFGEPREREGERESGEININVLSLFYGREGERAKKYTHTQRGVTESGIGIRDSGIGAAGPPSGGPLCYLLFVF